MRSIINSYYRYVGKNSTNDSNEEYLNVAPILPSDWSSTIDGFLNDTPLWWTTIASILACALVLVQFLYLFLVEVSSYAFLYVLITLMCLIHSYVSYALWCVPSNVQRKAEGDVSPRTENWEIFIDFTETFLRPISKFRTRPSQHFVLLLLLLLCSQSVWPDWAIFGLLWPQSFLQKCPNYLVTFWAISKRLYSLN